jgi:hypothetical protein
MPKKAPESNPEVTTEVLPEEPIQITEIGTNATADVAPDNEPVRELVVNGTAPIEASTGAKAVSGPPENKALSGSVKAATR